MPPIFTYILMHEEFDKTHHIAFLHLSSVHLLATASDLYWSEVKIRLVKFWPPASKRQKKNVLVCEIFNWGLKLRIKFFAVLPNPSGWLGKPTQLWVLELDSFSCLIQALPGLMPCTCGSPKQTINSTPWSLPGSPLSNVSCLIQWNTTASKSPGSSTATLKHIDGESMTSENEAERMRCKALGIRLIPEPRLELSSRKTWWESDYISWLCLYIVTLL